MVEAFGVEGLDDGLVTDSPGLPRVLGRLSKQPPILFQFPPRCVFGQPGKKINGECGLKCLLANA